MAEPWPGKWEWVYDYRGYGVFKNEFESGGVYYRIYFNKQERVFTTLNELVANLDAYLDN